MLRYLHSTSGTRWSSRWLVGFLPSRLVLLEGGRRQLVGFLETSLCVVALVPSVSCAGVGGHELVPDPAFLVEKLGGPVVQLNYHSDQYNI